MRMDDLRGKANLLDSSGDDPGELRAPNLSSAPADLTEIFEHYFEVLPADTQILLDEAYRLRYQVYCVEHAFENPNEHPDGREIDRFDAHSVHSVLFHRPTRSVVGTVRLILPSSPELPIRDICSRSLLETARCPFEGTAELSRFAISKKFRRRAEDSVGIDAALVDRRAISNPMDRRVIPHMALGLMKGAVQMSRQRGITHLFAIMEPALLRLLARLGIKFEPLGPPIEYHGLRQPCFGDIAIMEGVLRASSRDTWALITDHGQLIPKSPTSKRTAT